jgi:hypothetical protein
LNDAGWPSDETFRAFVEQGGGVVAVLGARSSPAGLPAGLPVQGGGGVVDRSADWGGTLAFLDYDHPVFELFRRPRSGDFSSARFLRYQALGAGDADVLARFDDGAPALVESRLGEGRVLVWATTLDTLWNDLPLQPVFLPFLHRLIAHAAGYVEEPAWRRVGEVLELPRLDGGRWVGLTPAAEKGLAASGGRFVALEEAGFYELRPSGEGSGPAVVTVAVNADPGESDLTASDPEEVVASLTRLEATPPGLGALGAGAREGRPGGWWLLLLAALGVLAAETSLSNRLSEAVR